MKKCTLFPVILAVTAVLTTLLITACDPIGYKLERETPLSNGVVKGNVYSMVPVNEKLYTANGRIYMKDFAGNDGWKLVDKPAGTSIVALASDNQHLYAKDRSGNVWAADASTDINSSSWNNKVYTNPDSDKKVFLIDNGVFDSTDGTTSGRNAYVVIHEDGKDKAYKLDGTTKADDATKEAEKIRNCYHKGSDDVFTDTFMMAANETGTKVYSVTSENREASSTMLRSNEADKGSTSNAVTYLFWTGTELLVGTTKNYEIWSADLSSHHAASDTAASIGNHSILGIWEYNGIRYASIYDQDRSTYNGLWAQPQKPVVGNWDKQ